MALAAHKVHDYLSELIAGPGPLRLRQLERDLRAALATAPPVEIRAGLHTALGMAYGQLGRLDDAVSHHTVANKLCPHNWLHPNNFGVTLDGFGKIEEALEWYVRATQCPDGGYNAISVGNAAIAMSRLGSYEEAIVALQEAIRLAETPHDFEVVASKAAELGLVTEAIRLLARAAVERFKIERGGMSDLQIIAAAPVEWRSAVAQTYDVQRMLLQAFRLGTELRHLQEAAPAHQVVGSPEERAALDEAGFETTRELRRRATACELAAYAHGS